MSAGRAIFIFLLLSVIFAVAGTAWWFTRYVKSPEFRQWVKQAASQKVGAPVEFDTLDVELSRGLRLTNLRIKSPRSDVPATALAIKEVTLAYDWPSLLQQIFKINKFAVVEPQLVVAQDTQGEYVWPYASKAESAARSSSTGTSTTGTAQSGTSSGMGLELSWIDLSLTNGKVTLLTKERTRQLQLESASVTAKRNAENPNASPITGQLSIGQLSLLDGRLLLQNVQAPYTFFKQTLQAPTIQAQAYDGQIAASFQQNFSSGQTPFGAQLNADNCDAAALFANAAPSFPRITGRLYGKTAWSGSFNNIRAIAGKGVIEVRNGQLQNASVFAALARVLNLPQLAKPEFTQCVCDFALANQVFTWNSVQIKSPSFEAAASGTSTFEGALALDVRLALHPDLAKSLPSMLLNRTTRREDGYQFFSFKVTGTLQQPNLDDLYRQLIVAPGGLLDQGAQRLQNLLQ